MYYKVYIKITESKKKRLLLFWLKCIDVYKGVKCVHLKGVSLSVLNVLFFSTALFSFVNILVVFLGEIFCMKSYY